MASVLQTKGVSTRNFAKGKGGAGKNFAKGQRGGRGKARSAEGEPHTTSTERCAVLKQQLVQDTRRVPRQWQTEDYAVLESVIAKVLQLMKVRPKIDCFATSRNRRFERWWGEGSPECQDAFTTSWSFVVRGLLWANPPYSVMAEVICKMQAEGAHMLLVAPQWDTKAWYHQMEGMAVMKVVCTEGSTVFMRDGVQCQGVRWPVVFALCCGHHPRCDLIKVQNGCLSRRQKRRLRKRQVAARCPDQGDL